MQDGSHLVWLIIPKCLFKVGQLKETRIMGWSTVILGGGRRATRTNRLQALKRGVPVGHWSTLQEVPTLKLGSTSSVKTSRKKLKGGL